MDNPLKSSVKVNYRATNNKFGYFKINIYSIFTSLIRLQKTLNYSLNL